MKKYHVLCENTGHRVKCGADGMEFSSDSFSSASEGSEHSEESTSEPTNDYEETEYKVFDPKYVDEAAAFDELDDLIVMLMNVQHSVLRHKCDKHCGNSCTKWNKYTYDVNYLEVIPVGQKVRKTKALKTLPLSYAFIQDQGDKERTCIHLTGTADEVLARIPATYAKVRQLNSAANAKVHAVPVFRKAMLDVASIRVLDESTNAISVVSPRTLVGMLVAKPPLDFSYAIGFLPAVTPAPDAPKKAIQKKKGSRIGK